MHTIYETDGPIATLTFNRPEARNAMTWEMYEALVDACDRVDRDAAIRVLICRGAGGKAFVAGTDIAQFQNFHNREDGLTYELRVATPEATFGIPIARTLGNCLSGASYSRLLDVMGPGAVKDMLFTG